MTTKRNKTKRKTERPAAKPSPKAGGEIPEDVKRAPLYSRQRIPGGRKYLDRSR